MPVAEESSARPLSVWIVFVIVFFQGAAVALYTLATAFLAEADVLDAAGQIALLVLFLLAGMILILLAFRIFLGSAAARTPCMVLQFLVVVLSIGFFTTGMWPVGIVFLVPAAAALVLLFIRPTQEWLEEAPEPSAD